MGRSERPTCSSADDHVMSTVECSIPPCMTIEQWRRQRSGRACDEFHETTTRYDREAKRLDFFLVCPRCRTARLIESLDYEPRFEPIVATVRPLRTGDAARPDRRAA